MSTQIQMRSYSDEEIKRFMNSKPMLLIGIVCSSIMVAGSLIELKVISERKPSNWLMVAAIQLIFFTGSLTLNCVRLRELKKATGHS